MLFYDRNMDIFWAASPEIQKLKHFFSIRKKVTLFFALMVFLGAGAIYFGSKRFEVDKNHILLSFVGICALFLTAEEKIHINRESGMLSISKRPTLNNKFQLLYDIPISKIEYCKAVKGKLCIGINDNNNRFEYQIRDFIAMTLTFLYTEECEVFYIEAQGINNVLEGTENEYSTTIKHEFIKLCGVMGAILYIPWSVLEFLSGLITTT